MSEPPPGEAALALLISDRLRFAGEAIGELRLDTAAGVHELPDGVEVLIRAGTALLLWGVTGAALLPVLFERPRGGLLAGVFAFGAADPLDSRTRFLRPP